MSKRLHAVSKAGHRLLCWAPLGTPPKPYTPTWLLQPQLAGLFATSACFGAGSSARRRQKAEQAARPTSYTRPPRPTEGITTTPANNQRLPAARTEFHTHWAWARLGEQHGVWAIDRPICDLRVLSANARCQVPGAACPCPHHHHHPQASSFKAMSPSPQAQAPGGGS
jgi:hypothetical protein